MSPLIQAENVTLRFRKYGDRSPSLKQRAMQMFSRQGPIAPVVEFDALKDINLCFKGGDRVAVIGLNGAGKSTLLKTIVGIYTPQYGRIRVEGSITPLIELGTGFDPDLTGRENIYLNGTMLRRSFRQMRQLESEIIEFAELTEFIDMPLKYYSSGMGGRLAFSIGTMVQPEILLVDEVFATGDEKFNGKAAARMHDLVNKSQIVIFVSHALDKILDICNRAVVLHKGMIVAEGSPEDMAEFYRAQIVGKPRPPEKAGEFYCRKCGTVTSSVRPSGELQGVGDPGGER
jgi:ABC-type polysaccharide/polyol phosphate transport system ATPase subunit